MRRLRRRKTFYVLLGKNMKTSLEFLTQMYSLTGSGAFLTLQRRRY